jgi:hypothetical protein
MTDGIFTGRAVDNSRVLTAGDADELLNVFEKLRNERADLNYLDFHCHGYAGTLSLGREDFNYKHLARFRGRGFESIFRPGAVISFLSCDVAAARFDEMDEDGELFLAEFAHIFLHGKGGRAIGRNMPMHYKPSIGIFVGPRFTTTGTEIIAEVAPGARYAVLKGQYRLDSRRIRLQIAVLKAFLNAAVQSLPSPRAPQSHVGDPIPTQLDTLVRTTVASLRNADIEKAQRIFSNSLKQLDKAEDDLRGLYPSPYLPLHKACQVINDVLDLTARVGVPWLRVLPALVNMTYAFPIPP